MKVKITNLGPVREAAIDLKPLTVFVGKNGTGKTWAAYALAETWGWHRSLAGGRYDHNDYEELETYGPLNAALALLNKTGAAKLDIVAFADQYLEKFLNKLGERRGTGLRRFFDTAMVSFENTRFALTLGADKPEILERIRRIDSSPRLGRFPTGSQLSGTKKGGDADFTLLLQVSGPTGAKHPPSTSGVEEQEGKYAETTGLSRELVDEVVCEWVYYMIHNACFGTDCIFPVERARTEPVPPAAEAVQDGKRTEVPEVWGVPEWLSRYDDLRSLLVRGRRKEAERIERAKTNSDLRNLLSLADVLENQVLCGRIQNIDAESPSLQFTAADSPPVELHLAASMVRELYSVVLYLRRLAVPGDWIIIDEPEMNLHPEAQVRMAEFLALLAQAGIRVTVTTHSPYIVDQLSNLMLAATCEDREGVKDLFQLKRTDAFIPRENVSIYMFENGTARDVIREDCSIDWQTFAKASDYIYDVYRQLPVPGKRDATESSAPSGASSACAATE